ncbi:hypothetical protein F5Y09DRAFT_329197 [Xylaria sp. FL1042]|nr:hypothetical protein F5Y09DRAFT_329197 [Xylaria sp. FL1042]
MLELYGKPQSDELISKLTRTPEIELWGMLKRSYHREARKPCRKPTYSSLGLLAVLPTELIFNIIEFLDFRSLSRLMRASLEWKILVEGLPAYVALTKHAQGELGTLGLTGIIKYHSASTLHSAFLSQKCVSCFEFGGFLFLPTCERICFALPMVQAVPGAYFVGSQQTQRRSALLLSVKQAKLLADKVHGSSRMTAIKYIESKPLFRSDMYQRFHHVSLKPPGRDLSHVRVQGLPVCDYFCGTAAIRFLYYISHNFESLPDHIKARAVPPGMDKSVSLRPMTTRLRSRSGRTELCSCDYQCRISIDFEAGVG